MPLKTFTQDDIESWTDEDVSHWLVTTGLQDYIENFRTSNITGMKLLSLTSSEVMALPGKDKRKKVLKKALSQLPGNAVAKPKNKKLGKKKSKTQVAAEKHKKEPRPPEPLPSSAFPPSLRPRPIPSDPPSSQDQVRVHSPNTDTYTDPSLIFTEHDQGLYDTAEGVMDNFNGMSYNHPGSYPPPLHITPSPPLSYPPPPHIPPSPSLSYPQPPHYPPASPSSSHSLQPPPPPPLPPQGLEGYQDDEQMIYDSYDDEVLTDSSFSSGGEEVEEEEEEDGVEAVGVSVNNVNGRFRQDFSANANIKAISAKFHVHGFKTSLKTTSTSNPTPTGLPEVNNDNEIGSDDDIYDVPPEELVRHAQPLLNSLPPHHPHPPAPPSPAPPSLAPPTPAHPPPSGEGEFDTIYDVVDELLQPPEFNQARGDIPVEVPVPPAEDPPLPTVEEEEMIYDMAAEEEEEEKEEESLPPRPPKTSGSSNSPVISRQAGVSPPLPFSHPHESPPSVGLSRVMMRPPIQSMGVLAPPRPSSSSKPSLSPSISPSSSVKSSAVTSPPRPSSSSSSSSRPSLSPSSPTSSFKPSSSSPPPLSSSPKPSALSSSPRPSASFKHSQQLLQPSKADPDPEPSIPLSPTPTQTENRHQSAARSPQMMKGAQKPSKPPELPTQPSEKESNPKPLSVPVSRSSMGQFVGQRKREGSAGKTETCADSAAIEKAGSQSAPRPALPNKPLSVQERIRQLKQGAVGQQSTKQPGLAPGPPPGDISPMSGRRVERKESVSELTRRYGSSGSGGGSDEESGRSTTPVKPLQPPKQSSVAAAPAAQAATVSPPHPLPEKPNSMEPQIPDRTMKPAKQPHTPPKHSGFKPDHPWRKEREEPPQRREREEPPQRREREEPTERREREESKEKAAGIERDASQMLPSGRREVVKHGSFLWRRSDPKPELPPQREVEEKPRTAPVTESPRTPRSYHYRPFSRNKIDVPVSPPPPNVPAPPPPSDDEPEPPKMQKPRITRRPHVPENQANLPPRPVRQTTFEAAPPRSSAAPLGGSAPALPSRPPPRHKPNNPEPPEPTPSLHHRPLALPQEPAMPPRPPKSSGGPCPPPVGAAPLPPRSLVRGSPDGQSWYHSNLKDRKKAEAMIKRYSRDGTFIVRDSSRYAGEYSLSVFCGGVVKNLRIRCRSDGKFVLGEEKEDEMAFDTVMDLVAYHKREPLVLKSGGEVVLKFECPH